MVEQDKYCVDILRQTYAVRKAIEKLEALILEQHLQTCVPEGIRDGKEEAVIAEQFPTLDVSIVYMRSAVFGLLMHIKLVNALFEGAERQRRASGAGHHQFAP